MSKKVKGQKMDLATFNSSGSASTPAPTDRSTNESGGQRSYQNENGGEKPFRQQSGRSYDNRNRSGNNFDDAGERTEDQDNTPWSRKTTGDKRIVESDNSQSQSDPNWRKATGSIPTPSRSSIGENTGSKEGVSEYKRLQLAPRSIDAAVSESTPSKAVDVSTSSNISDDAPKELVGKWSMVFAKSSSANPSSSSRFGRQGDDRDGGDRGANFNNRGSGGGGGGRSFGDDRERGGGGGRSYGDRDGGRTFADRDGGGGDRDGYRGGGGGGGGSGFRPRGDYRSEVVIDDPRFAGKFGSSGSGGGGGGRGGGGGGGGFRDRDGGGGGGGGGGYRDRDGGGGGGYRDRDGGGGGYRGGRGDRDGRSRYGGPTPGSDTGPLPSAPRAVRGATLQGDVLPAHLQQLAEPAATPEVAPLDPKAVKAAKAQAKEEADRRVREAKEAAQAQAAAQDQQRREQLERVKTLAQQGLQSGLKGSPLLALLRELLLQDKSESQGGLLGAALLQELLAGFASAEEAVGLSGQQSTKWWAADEFGAVLKQLLEGLVEGQVAALYAVQSFCHGLKFPGITLTSPAVAASKGSKEKGPTSKTVKLIEMLFNQLLSAGVVEFEGFLSWAEDEQDRATDSPGRLDALVQTGGFMMRLKELMQDDVEEADDDEVDAPREFVANRA